MGKFVGDYPFQFLLVQFRKQSLSDCDNGILSIPARSKSIGLRFRNDINSRQRQPCGNAKVLDNSVKFGAVFFFNSLSFSHRQNDFIGIPETRDIHHQAENNSVNQNSLVLENVAYDPAQTDNKNKKQRN